MADDHQLAKAKAAQRTACREAVAAMSTKERAAASNSICSQLLELLDVVKPGTVMGYMPLEDEPDILPVLEEVLARGSVLCLPRITGPGTMSATPVASLQQGDLVKGTHGISTPAGDESLSPAALDMILVPGLGFDAECNRLGRGGGYYDRFLEGVGSNALMIGCCFGCQLVDTIETGPGDVRLSKIIMSSTDN